VLQRIEPADHFTALGLERKATAADVKKAFFQLARELHPDTVQEGNAELRELKQRLFARVNEAAQVLSDEKRRKEHEDELDGKGSVDVARIFAAEEAFLRGEIMIKARKLVEGLALIDEAIELNQDEGEFYAWRGWARFLLAKDRKTQYPLSAADCRKALSMIDKCVPAWTFLGNMAKAMGELGEAEKSYRKVLELEPRNVDASRELRAMGRKLES
jgi:curved DNA-binding protein CbpA